MEELYKNLLLNLEQLLFNIRGDQRVVIVNDDDTLTAYGNERDLRKNKAEWLHYLVSNIFLNDNNQIEIHISDKF